MSVLLFYALLPEFNIFIPVLVWWLECEKQKCPESSVGERQECLNKLYECRVVWKARVLVDDNSHVLLNIMSIFYLVDNFIY